MPKVLANLFPAHLTNNTCRTEAQLVRSAIFQGDEELSNLVADRAAKGVNILKRETEGRLSPVKPWSRRMWTHGPQRESPQWKWERGRGSTNSSPCQPTRGPQAFVEEAQGLRWCWGLGPLPQLTIPVGQQLRVRVSLPARWSPMDHGCNPVPTRGHCGGRSVLLVTQHIRAHVLRKGLRCL